MVGRRWWRRELARSRAAAWFALAVPVMVGAGCVEHETSAGYRSVAGDQAWRWEGGARLVLRSLPQIIRPSEPFNIELEPLVGRDVARACRVEVSARPPEDAARRLVNRGRPDRLLEDPRTVVVVRPITPGEALTFPVALSDEWVWRTASIEAQLLCGDGVLEVVEGAAREGRGPFAGARTVATLGVVPTAGAGRTVSAPRIAAPITVDGVLNEAVWQDGRWPLYESRFSGVTARHGGQETAVKMAWDEEFLYVAGALTDADIVSSLEGRDAHLWTEDVLEVFVFSKEGAGYLEIQGSPDGDLFDASFTGHRQGGPAWDGGAKTAASVQYAATDSRQELGWQVEFALPWRDVCAHTDAPCSPAPNQTIKVNVFRIDKSRGGRSFGSALAPTWSADFHLASAAATVRLVADP